jgi:Heavy-metal-associated domain
MTCDGCVKDVSESLYKLRGITNVEANLERQLVTVEGTGIPPSYVHFAPSSVRVGPLDTPLTSQRLTAAPSAIVDAIQATGRDAILRGSGASNSRCRVVFPLPVTLKLFFCCFDFSSPCWSGHGLTTVPCWLGRRHRRSSQHPGNILSRRESCIKPR